MFIGEVISTVKDPAVSQIIVELGIREEGNVEKEYVEIRKLGFANNTTSEQIKKELNKFIITYNSDFDQSVVQSVIDEIEKQIDNVIEEVEGFVAQPELEKDDEKEIENE